MIPCVGNMFSGCGCACVSSSQVGIVYGSAGFKAMPEAIVIEVEDYTGPAFYPDEPKWVPILPMTSIKEGTRMMRTQFPVVAGYALTINKSQGLTLKEGVVINLKGGGRFHPASAHGKPFVGWTRSESFAMTAFKNLPAWEHFVKGRKSDMLRMRNTFVNDLWEKHRRTMQKHSDMITESDEDRAFEAWKKQSDGNAPATKKEGPRCPCPECIKQSEAS